MWAGLWQRKAKYQETNIAIAYEQQGYFEQAQGAYELAMSKYRNDYNNGASPVALSQEIKLVSSLMSYNSSFTPFRSNFFLFHCKRIILKSLSEYKQAAQTFDNVLIIV